MIDWTATMQQTFEYYIVDPWTWKDKERIDKIKGGSISRDSEAETLGSATFDATELLGECYIRAYLIIIQNGGKYTIPLGTFLVQTPSSNFDGKVRTTTMDAYTPLLELKESPPPLGYYIPKEKNILDTAYMITKEHMRAPVVKTTFDKTLYKDFVANTDDRWLSFVSDLLANAKYKLDLDELGRVLFVPEQDTKSLQPVWTYDEGNSSILYPSIKMEHDLYGIPNVVEVVYSEGGMFYQSRVVNDNPNSPISTVNRGREIIHRITDLDMIGNPTEHQIDLYAQQLLRELSNVEYTVTYTHGYCPVRLGDCVRLNYPSSGITDVKAKVKSQSIKCEPGCPVTETAIFTTNLWG